MCTAKLQLNQYGNVRQFSIAKPHKLPMDRIPISESISNALVIRGGQSTTKDLMSGVILAIKRILFPLVPSAILKYFALESKLKRGPSKKYRSTITRPPRSNLNKPVVNRLKNVSRVT